ncbi:MAG: hypothetical protein RSD49_06485 [Hafnia sp.]
MCYLTDLITKHGASNVLVFGPATPLKSSGMFQYLDGETNTIGAMFSIDEERDALADGYKISLEPLQSDVGRERFYLSDFSDMLDRGQYKLLVKTKEPIDREFFNRHDKSTVFFFDATYKTQRVGMSRLGPYLNGPQVWALLTVFGVTKEHVVFECDDPTLYPPNTRFEDINTSNLNGPAMLLLKLPSHKEHYATE